MATSPLKQAAKKKLPTPPKKVAAKPAAGSAKPAAKKASTYVAPKPLPVAKPIAAAKPAPDKVVGIGHNGGPVSISKQKLKAVIDRIENIEEEIDGLAEDRKEVYTEAKGNGFDVKTIRKIVAMRRRDKEALAAEKELMDIYLSAFDPELADVLS